MNEADFIKTPFDAQIFELAEDPSRSVSNKFGRELLAILNNLRILYVNLVRATTAIVWEDGVTDMWPTHAHVEWFRVSWKDNIFQVSSAYFHYIEYVSRINKYLSEKEVDGVPFSWRIQFYRNKAIEHWADYQALTTTTGSIGRHMISSNPRRFSTIMVPYHQKFVWERRSDEERFNELKKELALIGIDLNEDILGTDYYNYSNAIYGFLENSGQESGLSFPHSVTNALFSYSFPVPITDPESYTKELATVLAGISISGE